jgi:hypothetical protein
MCLFVETQYQCKHICFELYLFCREVLHELNRINDPDQSAIYALPFDPFCPACEPYTFPVGSTGYLGLDGQWREEILETNVVQWVVDLLELCPFCEKHGL